MNKSLCDCGRVATWCYVPGYRGGSNPYHCDDCVPRGCSCNHRYVSPDAYHPPLDQPDLPEGEEGKDWKWVESGVWTHIDDQGREFPCVEHFYEQEGWDLDEEENY